jgi:hypothetical protein
MTTDLACALLFDAERALRADHPEFAVAIPLLRRNRVPVAVLPRAAGLANEADSSSFKEYVHQERERYERHLAGYLEVADAWAGAGIEGVLIKSPGYFPYTSSNVDVLVAESQAGEACTILEDLGYRELTSAREPYKRLFRRLREPYLGFPIHVHTAVAWINRFFTDEEIIEGRRASEGTGRIAYPSAQNVFLVTTAHWLYEDKELTLRDLYHAALAVQDGVEWDSVRRTAESGGWRDGLELALAVYGVAAERFAGRDLCQALPAPELGSGLLRRAAERAAGASSPPLRLSKTLCKALQAAKTGRDPRLSGGAKARELSALANAAVRCKMPAGRNGPVTTVSLSGPDGAGKTTAARALQEFLQTEVGVAASYHWLRPGSSRGLEIIRPVGLRLFGAAERERSGASPGSRKTLLNSRPRLREAWCWVLLSDYVFRLLLEHIRCRLAGGIHIFDRYALDAAADLEGTYGFSNASLAVRITPSPTVQILITGRTGELPEHYDRYGGLASATVPERAPLKRTVTDVARLALEVFVESARGER